MSKRYEDIEVIEIDRKYKKSFLDKFKNLKIKYKKDSKKYLLLVSSFILVICLLIGTSYATLSYLSKTNNITKIEAGTLALELKNEENSIILNQAIPQEDKEALLNNKEYSL